MLNNKKGITLIALVVTVVVLIILAGVSINAVLGDNGIIKKANQAASVTTEASKVVLRKNIQQKQTKLKVIRTAKNLRKSGKMSKKVKGFLFMKWKNMV